MGDLCTACMCSGRNLYYIGETGYHHLYSQILNEIQIYDTSQLYIRVCWECRAVLRRWLQFTRRVKLSHNRLQYMLQNNFSDIAPEPPRLQICQVVTESFPLIAHIKSEEPQSPLSPSPHSVCGDYDSVKEEATHCEPETFVNDLQFEPKKKKDKKPVPEDSRLPVVSDSKLPDKPQCAECGKHFSSKKTYRYHLNVLHKGQNRYPCPRCGKVYQWKSNLGRHLRSHKARDSGELYCAVCDKRFASVATYKQHLRVSRRHVTETDFSGMSIQTAVDTPVGQILGLVRNDYKAFLGIPYGVVDENNPFENAKPHPPFETPFSATSDAVMCPQYFKGAIKGSLQCLNLNIYTPIAIGRKSLPVMVYIHGGAFTEGNVAENTYPPTFLIKHDVIVVMMYYRLGPYGHLCIPKYSNQALKDQQLALKWVKNNIASFGGDNENILLFGHSSGSMTVDLQMFNNNNLFNKVILQSGQAVSPYIVETTDVTKLIIKDVGLDPENVDYDNFVQTLCKIPTYTLINMTMTYNFRPCIDNEFVKKEPKVNLENMKILVGSTTREALYFYPEEIYDHDYTREELEKGFEIQDGADDAVRLIKDFYSYNPKDNFIDFVSDYGFNYPIERSVRFYLENNVTVYRYLFSYDGGRNYMKYRDDINATGPAHGDELGYLYDMKVFSNTTEDDQTIIDIISLVWTNFAKYGDPTPSPSTILPKWPPVTSRQAPYLLINTSPRIDSAIYASRMEFWHTFYEKYGKYAKGISLGEPWQANL
uniref:C2H2-type domain-containing protein n=1 Tax=Heliothis virescens TaxID=7102 RepID=A0A2A4JFD1_HELVI